MNFWDIYGKFDFIVMLLVAEIFICARFPKRKNFILRFIIGTVPAMIVSYFGVPFMPRTLWAKAFKFLIVFACTLIPLFFAYKGRFWSYLFSGVLSYCVQHISYQTHTIIDILTGRILPQWALALIVWGIFALILGAIWFFIIRRMKKDEIFIVNSKKQLLLSALVLIITVFISFFGVIYSRGDRMIMIIMLSSIISCLFGIFLSTSLLKIQKDETELILLRHLVHAGKHQFELSKENIDLINIKCHDLRHQLSRLKDKIDEEELLKITQAIDIYDNTFKTGNNVLDVVLTEKGLICKEKGIRLTCMLDGETLSQMNSSDIYSLFGNAIENAIESVELLEEDKKSISISEMKRLGFSMIRIENFYSGSIEFENGMPITKKSKDYHGFGVKSIKMIAEKYGGEMQVSLSGDIFRLEIILPTK